MIASYLLYYKNNYMNTFCNKTYYALISLFLILLSGCVDLSRFKSQPLLLEPKSYEKSLYNGEVHTMRGGLGIFSIGMNQLRQEVSQQFAIPAESSMWYDAGHVSRAIAAYYFSHPKPHRPIILIGHSLGANEQIKVARNLNALVFQ